jgi:hypothetical protein
MYKKKTFVSFDYTNNHQYKYLLNAFSANPNFDFTFDDKSSIEINSNNISVIKANLTKKIEDSTYVIVIVGAEANKLHKGHVAIGYRNWQNFEIAKAKQFHKQLVAIKIKQEYESPEELLNSGARWAYSFSVEGINKALNG